MKPIYTAPTVDAARAVLDDLSEIWRKKYGAIIRLFESAWDEFTPYDPQDSPSDLLHQRD